MNRPKPIAVVDCGTNVLKFLLGSWDGKKLQKLEALDQGIKLGETLVDNLFTKESLGRCQEALGRFLALAKPYGLVAKDLHCFGTSVFRKAENHGAFFEKVKAATGVQLRLISGETEAALTYEGVLATGAIGDEPVLVMDIGGGSVECILGNQKGILKAWSIEAGTQWILNLVGMPDELSPAKRAEASAFIEQAFKEVAEAFRDSGAKTLIGTSGTFETLSQALGHPPGLAKTPLELEKLKGLVQDILTSKREWRSGLRGMEPVRVDMIMYSAMLIDELLHKTQCEKAVYSSYSVKEAYLVRMAKESEPDGQVSFSDSFHTDAETSSA